MIELGFRVIDVLAERYAATPSLTARLEVSETTGASVHAMALRAQVMIEPQRRRYGESEAAGLVDQFGTRDRWSSTLKPFLWLHCSTMVRGFTGSTAIDLPMPVTYDFEVTASKYLHQLESGGAPLDFLFSGTCFTRGENGFAVEQVPWHLEDRYLMPVEVWRECMDLHFPGAGWLRLDRETLAELTRYKATHQLTSWDSVIGSLLTGEAVRR